jgi:hypothetical protein
MGQGQMHLDSRRFWRSRGARTIQTFRENSYHGVSAPYAAPAPTLALARKNSKSHYLLSMPAHTSGGTSGARQTSSNVMLCDASTQVFERAS